CQLVDRMCDRGVDTLGWNDLVDERPSVRAVCRDRGVEVDRATSCTLADELRQPEVGDAGNDALLAGRQAHPRALLRDDVVHHEQELKAATDRMAVDNSDEWLFDLGSFRGCGEPAQDLVDEPELASNEVCVRQPTFVELGEVDPRAEHAAA